MSDQDEIGRKGEKDREVTTVEKEGSPPGTSKEQPPLASISFKGAVYGAGLRGHGWRGETGRGGRRGTSRTRADL